MVKSFDLGPATVLHTEEVNLPAKDVTSDDPEEHSQGEAARYEDKVTFNHRYYCEKDERTVLLFGSNNRHKLFVLNLMWHCCQEETNLIADVSNKIDTDTFTIYHIRTTKTCIIKLTVIVCPFLTDSTLKNLKRLLTEGSIKITAFAFVVKYYSTPLKNEKLFFKFLQSNFGDILSKHLFMFLTCCGYRDDSNCPVRNELYFLTFRKNSFVCLSNAVRQCTCMKEDCICILTFDEIFFTEKDVLEVRLFLIDLQYIPRFSTGILKGSDSDNPSKFLTMSSLTDLEVELRKKVFLQLSSAHGETNALKIRKLKMSCETIYPDFKLQVLSLMGEQMAPKKTKVILLIGGVGTGKSTFINAMVNYIFRIDYKDSHRLILIDDHDNDKYNRKVSQTDMITCYCFPLLPGMPLDYNLILIDTPGFADARGPHQDLEFVTQLESFVLCISESESVDVVGFVTPDLEDQCNIRQNYIFDELKSMFGDDAKENFYMMSTFADSSDRTDKAKQLLLKGRYKFNNSAIYLNNNLPSRDDASWQSEDNYDYLDNLLHMHKQFWEIAYQRLQHFFTDLGEFSNRSVNLKKLTKDLLKMRKQLPTLGVSLRKQIQRGLPKLVELQQGRVKLSNITNDIELYSNYKYEVTVEKCEKVKLNVNESVTNCRKCNVTCHFPCATIENCTVMADGLCIVCPGRCSISLHSRMDFRYETTWVKEERIIRELHDRYTASVNESEVLITTIKDIEKSFTSSKKRLEHDLLDAKYLISRLEQTSSLKSSFNRYTMEYIDHLLASEKAPTQWIQDAKKINKLLDAKIETSILSTLREAYQAGMQIYMADQFNVESLLEYYQKLSHFNLLY